MSYPVSVLFFIVTNIATEPLGPASSPPTEVGVLGLLHHQQRRAFGRRRAARDVPVVTSEYLYKEVQLTMEVYTHV